MNRRLILLCAYFLALAANVGFGDAAGLEPDGPPPTNPTGPPNNPPPAPGAPTENPGGELSKDGAPTAAVTEPPPPPVPAQVETSAFQQAASSGSTLDALKADPMSFEKRTAYQQSVNQSSSMNQILNKAAEEKKWDAKDVKKTQKVMALLSQGSGLTNPTANSPEADSSETKKSTLVVAPPQSHRVI